MRSRDVREVFFVDDEPCVRRVVRKTLEGAQMRIQCFASARECLKQLKRGRCDLLITDVKMAEMDGLELLKTVRKTYPWLPVVVVTGYGDVPMAVRALKAGASDFIEKPLDRDSVLSALESILESQACGDDLVGDRLTDAERKVLQLILEGRSNREIAEILHRSTRTVEVHRSRLMRKMGVDNLVELIKRSAAMGLIDVSQ